MADLDGRRGRLHPDGHAAHHPRRCRPRRRRPFRAQPGHAGRIRVHSGGRVLGSADPGRTARGPLRASGDAGRQRSPAGVWADPVGACDIHARRGCGPRSRRYRRCDRLRGDAGAHPTMVPCATGARDDSADDDRRPTGSDSVRRPVRRTASPQRVVDRIHQRRRRQCADGSAGIRGRAQRPAGNLGADSHRVGPRHRRCAQAGVGAAGDTPGVLRPHGHAVSDDGVRATVGSAVSRFRAASFGVDGQLAHHGLRPEHGGHRTRDRRADVPPSPASIMVDPRHRGG